MLIPEGLEEYNIDEIEAMKKEADFAELAFSKSDFIGIFKSEGAYYQIRLMCGKYLLDYPWSGLCSVDIPFTNELAACYMAFIYDRQDGRVSSLNPCMYYCLYYDGSYLYDFNSECSEECNEFIKTLQLILGGDTIHNPYHGKFCKKK